MDRRSAGALATVGLGGSEVAKQLESRHGEQASVQFAGMAQKTGNHAAAISASTRRVSPGSSSAANGLSRCLTSDSSL